MIGITSIGYRTRSPFVETYFDQNSGPSLFLRVTLFQRTSRWVLEIIWILVAMLSSAK